MYRWADYGKAFIGVSVLLSVSLVTGSLQVIYYEYQFVQISLHFVLTFTNRNHGWVSFQAFAEAYNDSFNPPPHLGLCSVNEASFVCSSAAR